MYSFFNDSMISFSHLGVNGRLGNHLFQYAFLRTTALRLGVKFYCPAWAGDSFFDLQDQEYRVATPPEPKFQYCEKNNKPGFNLEALRIQDRTNIQGYFQSEQYFNRRSVLDWYQFRENKISRIKNKYKNINFNESVGISVRMGDFLDRRLEKKFYIARRFYYINALKIVRAKRNIIVFSDDVPKAKVLLGDLGSNMIFIEDYEPYEGLYLQSQCHDFICSTSTYSWWGAWLNDYPNRIVVAPREGPFRPGARLEGWRYRIGARLKNESFWPASWVTCNSLYPLIDNYHVIKHFRPFFRDPRLLP